MSWAHFAALTLVREATLSKEQRYRAQELEASRRQKRFEHRHGPEAAANAGAAVADGQGAPRQLRLKAADLQKIHLKEFLQIQKSKGLCCNPTDAHVRQAAKADLERLHNEDPAEIVRLKVLVHASKGEAKLGRQLRDQKLKDVSQHLATSGAGPQTFDGVVQTNVDKCCY